MTSPSSTSGTLPNIVRESEGAVLSALAEADMGVFVLGPDFSVQWVNETAGEYFGIDPSKALGADKASLIQSEIKHIFEEPERFADTVLSTYEDNSYVEEFECHVRPGADRRERWLRHQSRPIETGALAGGRVEQYTDISERKERKRELERQNEKLERFTSVVSHDLRNPLLVAAGRLSLAQETGESEHVAEALTAVERGQSLIDDLLTLSRQGDVVGEVEPVDLPSLVDDCWQTVETRTATRTVATEQTVRADRSRLQQILENFIRNAVEHAGPEVEITVGDLEDGFYVADDGPGVPPRAREDAFTPGVTTTEDGTGFGLAIVEEIVTAHGWQIRLTDSESGGARFEITGVETV
ncbi:PAS domain-containing sensor histidine kinase [Haloarcula sediminis]|uniref:PAS domain-containing sensor histidine kinase n=1 Tax=Haloarcula sediminis TaxID=3111777 RepID=UPI002D7895D8|nr:PAS domain-containing sensor histidine kinase [Haloarcula sp. CK38]